MRRSIISQVQPAGEALVTPERVPDPPRRPHPPPAVVPGGLPPPGVMDHTRPGPCSCPCSCVSSSMHQMQPGIPQCISPWPAAAAMDMLDVSECLLFQNKLEYIPIYICSLSGFAPFCIYLMYGNSPHVHLFYVPAHSCCFCSFSASLCNVSN